MARSKAIICDIDGTLAHMTGRSPYDYTLVSTDVIDPVVRDIVNFYYQHEVNVVLVSGRKRTCWQDTVDWLMDNQIQYTDLFMRSDSDNRSDTIIKKEIYDEFIKDYYDVLFVLDDRDRVVKMWREELGLKCLQVQPGDF
jgi:hypothetical protein